MAKSHKSPDNGSIGQSNDQELYFRPHEGTTHKGYYRCFGSLYNGIDTASIDTVISRRRMEVRVNDEIVVERDL